MSAMLEQGQHAEPAKGGDPHGSGHGGAPSGHGGAPSGHGEGTAHEGHHGPGDINWFDFSKAKQPPYIASLINFGILLWIFWRFGKEPIARALTNRRETVKREIDEAQRIKKEAQARAKKYQKQLEHLDEELEGAKKSLVEAGTADKQRIVREAEEKAARMERDAQALLGSEIAQAKQDLTRETVGLAVTAAEELLRTKITASDHERLAEEFLTDLVKRNAKDKPAGSPTTPPSGPRGSGGAGGGGSARPPIPRPASVPPRPSPGSPGSAPPPRAQTSPGPVNGSPVRGSE